MGGQHAGGSNGSTGKAEKRDKIVEKKDKTMKKDKSMKNEVDPSSSSRTWAISKAALPTEFIKVKVREPIIAEEPEEGEDGGSGTSKGQNGTMGSDTS